jgi:non-ribosomal peptide synthetase component F
MKNIEKLLQLASAIRPVAPTIQVVPKGSPIAVGQIWTAQPTSQSEEPLVLLVTAVFEDIITVMPIVSDVYYASSQDIVLPREVLGFDAAVFILETTVLQDALQRCEGRIPQETRQLVAAYLQHLKTGRAKPDGVVNGMPFLDEKDPAYKFRGAVADQLNELASSAIALHK